MIPEELRNRLEEAAKEKQREVTPHKDWGDVRYGFNRGAEWMFKEAGGETVLKEMRQTILGQCKEWMKKNVPIIHTEDGDYVRVNMGHKNVPLTIYLADFEADMNKLWEGDEDA